MLSVVLCVRNKLAGHTASLTAPGPDMHGSARRSPATVWSAGDTTCSVALGAMAQTPSANNNSSKPGTACGSSELASHIHVPPPVAAASPCVVAPGHSGQQGGALTASGYPSPTWIVGYTIEEGGEVLHTPLYPSRPGIRVCGVYQKTGYCKSGERCQFDHPRQLSGPLTELGLPYRPEEPMCQYYLKYGRCSKFHGVCCSFHHPKLKPMYASQL